MAGSSSRGKSPGSGYQGAGAKTDYSSRARDSYSKTIAANQRMNNIAPNTTTVNKNPTNPIGRRYAEAIGPMKAKAVPRTYLPTVKPPVAVVVKPPAKKLVVKPTAKKITPSMLRSALGLAPTKSARVNAKPPATRFGVVTGKTTGTRVSGGGGYGGGGTRGGGSLSGQGSGSRSAGTSRTGGTQRNDPVRG